MTAVSSLAAKLPGDAATCTPPLPTRPPSPRERNAVAPDAILPRSSAECPWLRVSTGARRGREPADRVLIAAPSGFRYGAAELVSIVRPGRRSQVLGKRG